MQIKPPKNKVAKLNKAEKIEVVYWAHYKNLPKWKRDLIDQKDEKEMTYLAKDVAKYLDEKNI